MIISILFTFLLQSNNLTIIFLNKTSISPSIYIPKEKNLFSNSYTIHSPINITSNADFANQALKEGWTGNGSKTNPYVIENYNITANGTKITIQNTSVYFLIQNIVTNELICTDLNASTLLQISCYKYFTDKLASIFLNNVSNGIINAIKITDYSESGMYIGNSSNLIIENNDIIGIDTFSYSSLQNGIYLIKNSINNSLINNTILMGYSTGIFVSSSSLNLIANNTIVNNYPLASYNGLYLVHGLWLDLADKNTIISNKVINTGISINMYPSLNQINTEFINNFVNGKQFLFLFNITNQTYSTNIGQIIAINSSRITIDGQNLSNAYIGIYLYQSSNFTIKNSIINQNSISGIDVYQCTNVTIRNNSFDKNSAALTLKKSNFSSITYNKLNQSFGTGLGLYSSYNDNIMHNNITLSSENGLSLYQAANLIIAYNTINFNLANGINLEYSQKNTLFNNSISINSKNGLYLDSSCCNNIVWNNISYNDNYGVYFTQTGNNMQEKFQNNTISYNYYAGISPTFISGYDSYLQKNNVLVGNQNKNITSTSVPLTLSDILVPLGSLMLFSKRLRKEYFTKQKK